MFKIGNKVYADLAALIAALSALPENKLKTTLKGASLQRWEDAIADELQGGADQATAVATIIATMNDIVDDGADFLAVVSNTTSSAMSFATNADKAATMVANRQVAHVCRLIACRETNQKSSDGKATQLLVSFRNHDGSEFSGFTYSTYLKALADKGSFTQVPFNTKGLLECGNEPIVSINIVSQEVGVTGYESANVKDIAAAKAANAYITRPTRGTNVGKEVCFVYHTTSNACVYRSFRDGKADMQAYQALEAGHLALVTAKADALTASTTSRSAADDEAYKVNVVDKASVEARVHEQSLMVKLRIDNAPAISAFAKKEGMTFKEAAELMYP